MTRRASVLFALSITLVCAGAFAQDAQSIYQRTCAACHGPDGSGVTGVGPSLKASQFVSSSSIDEIASTIRNGRMGDEKRYPDYPAVMPPNPQLSDVEVRALAEYVKSEF